MTKKWGNPELPREAIKLWLWPFLNWIIWYDTRSLRLLKRSLVFGNYVWRKPKKEVYRHEMRRYADRYQ